MQEKKNVNIFCDPNIRVVWMATGNTSEQKKKTSDSPAGSDLIWEANIFILYKQQTLTSWFLTLPSVEI